MSKLINQTAPDTTDEVEAVMDPVDVADLKKKSVSGAASYMARTLVLHGISLAALSLLAAYLTANDFGIYGIVTQIIGLLTFFSDIGFGSALIQKKTEPTTTEYRAVFTVQQLLSWFIFGCTVLIAALGFLTPKIGWQGNLVLMALGFSFPLVTLKTIPSVMLERRLDFGKLVIPQILEQLVYNGLLIVLAINGWGVLSYFYAVLGRAIIGVISMWYLQRWPIGFSLDQAAIKRMLGSGAKFQLNDFLARLKDQLFFLVLGLYLPTDTFGYITLSKTFSMLPYQLSVQNVIAITFPTYARLQHDKQLLRKAIEKTLFFIALLTFPMIVGMCIFIFPITELIPKYAKWQPALFTFVLLTLSIGWGAISTPLTNTLNAIGHINTTLKLMVMWTVLTWALTPIFVWWLGFNGVAVATFLISFSSILPIYYVRKIVPINVWDQTWRQLLAAGGMALVGYVGLHWWATSFLHLGLGMVAVAATYAGVLFAVGKNKVLAEVKSLRSKV